MSAPYLDTKCECVTNFMQGTENVRNNHHVYAEYRGFSTRTAREINGKV